ncbi:MAG: polyribonucleotide nucleotidyltransferase [Firmicutes bacterium]|nr:polyribonucleotide nucleotidyltransferase [Bacillota bacterium]
MVLNEVALEPGISTWEPETFRCFETDFAGRPLRIEVGKMATQAGGACLVRYGDTAVLVTATASQEPREGVDFLPLTVDYEERLYAVGRIPGSWHRREGRPSTRAILSGRLIDRPIRPLFPEGLRHDVQVIVTVLSVDHDHSPEVCGLVGASVALSISDIPWNGPVGGCEVGLVDGQVVLNPTLDQHAASPLGLVVAGTEGAVIMVEAGAREVPEEDVLRAIAAGHDECRRVCRFIADIAREVGKPKRQLPLFLPDAELERRVREYATPLVRELLGYADKTERERAEAETEARVHEHFAAEFPESEAYIAMVLKKILKEEMRRRIIEEGIRPDGRRPDEIRRVWCQVGLLPRAHGSGLFTRGQTQVLTVATLGAVGDVQLLDDTGEEEEKRFMHHYNFPPYSTGETRPLRGPGRREIGHGALAERALEAVIPPEDVFPYTLRLVSEVLESNGSTSMASVCGSTLALMDAGVPITAPVSGVAMGLIKEGDRVVILSDIQGMEDALGDMDFKVAGTTKGITALQMDIKIPGVTVDILRQALEQARRGRLYILDHMLRVLPAPRPQLSRWAPRILSITIHPDRIRDVIGPGGKTINRIVAETGTKIDVESDGRVFVAGPAEGAEKALEIIRGLTAEPEVGHIYRGKVTRVTNFGAFVEILPGKEGLVHISELSDRRVNRVEDVVNVGDEVLVKLTEIDRMGRINLSRRQALPPEQGGDQRRAPERHAPGHRRPGGHPNGPGGRPHGPGGAGRR